MKEFGVLPIFCRRTDCIALALLLLLVATAALCWPALNGPFLFDDFPNLIHLAILNGRLDFASLANYASLFTGQPGRPLSMLSFVINDFDWPSDPWSFKYTNLLIHLLIGVFVFGFSRSLSRLLTTERRADHAALLAAAAWLLHPMQLSTSMLVVQRMTQLSALFVIAGLWGYVGLACRAKRPATAISAIALLGLGTVLAVLSKESGALAPLLAVVLNVTLLRDRLSQLSNTPRRLLQWGAALPVLGLLTALVWRWGDLTNYGKRTFTMGERLLSQSRALCDYLFNIVLPNLRGGGIYHDDFTVSQSLTQPWTTLPAVLLVSGLVVGALLCHRRWPLLGFALLWYFGGHLLESTVFPLELYFEHRNYLPMFGILFALALWAVQASRHWGNLAIGLAWLWIAFAAWLTSVQAPIWGDRDALVTIWAIEHPQSARAVQEHASYYYRHSQYQEAAEVLLDGYSRGVRGSDFPAQVLLLACTRREADMAERANRLLRESLRSGEYNNALPITMRKLRLKVQSGSCPLLLTEDGWLQLTDRLLENPNYSTGTPSSYLHVERAYLFQHRRDLNRTMLEFEMAWDARESSELAQLMAVTLASAGLYQQAETWAHRAAAHQVPGVRGWLAQDDARSRRLLEALKVASEKQRNLRNDGQH